MTFAETITAGLADLRALAESLMVDACVVTKPGAATWDESTGANIPGAPVTLYAGPCRVQVPESVPGAPVAGEAEWVTAATVVSLPVVGSEAVTVGATVTITDAAEDRALVGQEYEVAGIPLAKSHATTRRLRCVAVAR